MTLHTTLRDMIAEADRAGRAGPRKLKGGAHLEVRSRTTDGMRKRQLRISRVGVAPSPTEVVVFMRDAQIPPDASESAFVRGTTHIIAVTWEIRILDLPVAALPAEL